MKVGTKPPVEDADLVARCRQGETAAFGLLVERYQDRLFTVCYRMCGHREDAADLAQEAFLKAFSSLERFGARSQFYTWLYRIAVNLVIDRRRRKPRPTRSLGPGTSEDADRGGDAEPAARERSAEAVVAAAEDQASIERALQSIDDAHRAVVVLRDVDGLDYEQIGEILEIPVGTVKSRLSRARLALREKLRPILGEADT